jgi:predicted cobalt transporter CbtA
MTGTLLARGMLVGIIAGLLAFGFAKVFGEPQVDRAIAFESAMDAAKEAAEAAKAKAEGKTMDMPEEVELFSRDVQSGIGLFTGVMAYGIAFGGLFSLVFAYCYGRLGKLGPRPLAALIAAAGFIAIVLVPDLKYPANPPSVGNPDTIGHRTGMFFLMIVISIAAMVAAVNILRRLHARYGTWNAVLIAGAAFIAVIVVAQLLLPDINEVPDEFPAVVLWRFRAAALGIQLVMWTSLGLIFGWLTERSLQSRFRFARPVAS